METKNDTAVIVRQIQSICAEGQLPCKVYGDSRDLLPKIITIHVPAEVPVEINRAQIESRLIQYCFDNKISYEIIGNKNNCQVMPKKYMLKVSPGCAFDMLEYKRLKELMTEETNFQFSITKEYGSIFHHYNMPRKDNDEVRVEDNLTKWDSQSACATTLPYPTPLSSLPKRKPTPKPKRVSWWTKAKNRLAKYFDMIYRIPFIARKIDDNDFKKALKELSIDEKQVYIANIYITNKK